MGWCRLVPEPEQDARTGPVVLLSAPPRTGVATGPVPVPGGTSFEGSRGGRVMPGRWSGGGGSIAGPRGGPPARGGRREDGAPWGALGVLLLTALGLV